MDHHGSWIQHACASGQIQYDNKHFTKLVTACLSARRLPMPTNAENSSHHHRENNCRYGTSGHFDNKSHIELISSSQTPFHLEEFPSCGSLSYITRSPKENRTAVKHESIGFMKNNTLGGIVWRCCCHLHSLWFVTPRKLH